MNPFDKDFWLNPDHRNIRRVLYHFLSPIDHLHIYGHKVYNTCAECYKTVLSNDVVQCYRCKCWNEYGCPVFLKYCSEHSHKVNEPDCGMITHTCKKHRLI